MADTYVQGSFVFTCSNAEMALIEEAFQASYDLTAGLEPSAPSTEFLAAFPRVAPEDPWSGFRDIFCDPDFPTFGVDFEGGNSIADPDICTVILFGTTDFQAEPIATLLQRCCQASLCKQPIGFEWAVTCSKPRIGEFGGGFCAIFADRIVIQATSEGLAAAMLERNPLAAQ